MNVRIFIVFVPAALIFVGAFAQPAPLDLSKLEVVATVNAPGHEAGTLFSNEEFGVRAYLAFSPDGTRLASLDTNGVLKLWDVRSGEELKSFTGIDGTLLSFRDAQTVWLEATEYNPPPKQDVKKRLSLDLRTGKTAQDPDRSACARGLETAKLPGACSSDKRTLVRFRQYQQDALNLNVVVDIVDAASGKLLRTVRNPSWHVDQGLALSFSPDGSTVAAQFAVKYPGEDGSRRVGVQVFTVKDGETRSVFETGEANLTWFDNGHLMTERKSDFASGYTSPNPELRLWDTRKGEVIWTLEARENASSPAPSPDGKCFAVVREGSYPELRDTDTREVLLRFGHSITGFAFTPNGKSILTASAAGRIRAWNTTDGKETAKLTGRDGYISSLAVSPDAQIIAADYGDIVQLWNADGTPRATFNATGGYSTSPIAFSLDGRILVKPITKTENRTATESLLIWRVADGAVVKSPQVPTGSNLRFINSSSVVLREDVQERPRSSGGGTDTFRRLSLMRLEDGTSAWEGVWRQFYDQKLVVSPDGNLLVRDRDSTSEVDVIETMTGNALRHFGIPLLGGTPDYDGTTPEMIAPDNRTLLVTQSGGDGCGGSFDGVRAYDLQTGVRLPMPTKLEKGYNISTGCGSGGAFPEFTFSPDGRYLAVKFGNTIDLWGTRNRRAIFLGR